MTIRPTRLNVLFATLAAWRQRSRARQALAQLDRHALRDVGIDPGLAAFEAAQPFWRELSLLRELPTDGHPANDDAALPSDRAERRHLRVAAGC